jgi:hypothetical protein
MTWPNAITTHIPCIQLTLYTPNWEISILQNEKLIGINSLDQFSKKISLNMEIFFKSGDSMSSQPGSLWWLNLLRSHRCKFRLGKAYLQQSLRHYINLQNRRAADRCLVPGTGVQGCRPNGKYLILSPYQSGIDKTMKPGDKWLGRDIIMIVHRGKSGI